MTTLTLVSNSKNNIDLVIEPKKTGDAVTEVTIQALIDGSEYVSLFINSANIKNAVAELNDVLKPLQAEKTGREIRYQILERRNATISITIDSDEMGATAEISTALGGKHLSAKAILNSAQDSGVKKGFSKEDLIKLAHLASKEPAGSTVSLQIAMGKEAINGKNAKIKHLVQSAQERILRPKEREDGSVDMRDLGDIVCVKVGDSLAKKIPLTQGKQGYTVTASPLAPEPGEDISFNAGEGTSFSPRDDHLLISKLVGLPKIIDNGMEVDEVYKIKNVDVSTGNINFEGSVIIDGDICEGMKVVASGDINVAGFVESAILQAGGDITITGGIIGRKQDVENAKVTDLQMSVNISAKGKLYAKYCQYAEISCGSDVRIENQLMHSILNIGGRLWLGSEEKANGKLIGGYIKVGTSVHAGIVGATAGSNTIINFEAEILKFKALQSDIETRLKIESDKTNELKLATNKLKKLPKDKANPAMLSKVVATYRHHAKLMGVVLEEKQELEDKLQEYMSSVYIEATEKLYHGVELIVGDFNDRSRREYGPSRMIYKERKIHIDPIVNT
ncbi:MAG: FapA family protein [Colwellia sp.]|nr:FapA family protein [Colwellia sp.]